MKDQDTTVESSRIQLTGQLIKNFRLEKGWSQEMMAEKIGLISTIPITKYAVNKWEKFGQEPIKATKLNLKSLEKLLFGEEIMSFDLFTNLISLHCGFDKKKSILGKYKSTWGFDNEENIDFLEFEEKEQITVGRVVAGKFDYELCGYLFSNRIFSGYWFNTTNSHQGTFTLQFSFDFMSATGNWIGTIDREHHESVIKINEEKKKEKFKYGYWYLNKVK